MTKLSIPDITEEISVLFVLVDVAVIVNDYHLTLLYRKNGLHIFKLRMQLQILKMSNYR